MISLTFRTPSQCSRIFRSGSHQAQNALGDEKDVALLRGIT